MAAAPPPKPPGPPPGAAGSPLANYFQSLGASPTGGFQPASNYNPTASPGWGQTAIGNQQTAQPVVQPQQFYNPATMAPGPVPGGPTGPTNPNKIAKQQRQAAAAAAKAAKQAANQQAKAQRQAANQAAKAAKAAKRKVR